MCVEMRGDSLALAPPPLCVWVAASASPPMMRSRPLPPQYPNPPSATAVCVGGGVGLTSHDSEQAAAVALPLLSCAAAAVCACRQRQRERERERWENERGEAPCAHAGSRRDDEREIERRTAVRPTAAGTPHRAAGGMGWRGRAGGDGYTGATRTPHKAKALAAGPAPPR